MYIWEILKFQSQFFKLEMSSRLLRNVPHFRLLLVVFVLLVLGLWEQNVVGEEDSSNANGDNMAATAAGVCNINLNNFLPLPYSNLPNMICKPVWNTYFLRYSRTRDNVVTIVLSATYTTGWVGIGFSKDGMMLNSSAIVGWITEKGVARIKQYYVSGFTPEEIKPDKGELPLTSVPPFVTVYGATIYLAFQLNFAALSNKQAILLAFGTRYPVHHHLTLHNDKTTIRFDFSAGSVDYSSATASSGPNDISSSRKTHGVLGLLGWGLILPVGAIFARYLKHRDPLWYYLHVVIQFVGFIIALAAVVVGRSLYDRISANIPAHRGVGIFALVLSILQVLAFFLRPHKESKNRRYWNWYHHWFGRVALFFGTLNIVLGIHYAHAGDEWKIGFGFVLGIILFSCVVLEVLLRMRRPKEVPPPSDFQMNPF